MPSFDRIKSLVGSFRARFLVGAIVLTCYASAVGCLSAAEPLIERGTGGWRYCETPAVDCEAWQPDGWTAVDFEDSTWREGKALLGYGDPDVTTELSYGIHPQRKESSALFRRRFRIARSGQFRLLRGHVCCDDGAVVFINGREVFRYNLPSGTITHSTRAVRALGPAVEDERRYHQFVVTPDTLTPGDNVVAVSVHQANATSSDLAMDLELTGLTTDQEVSEAQGEIKRQAELEDQTAEGGSYSGPVVRFDLSGD
jgi:hypothetical protein